MYMKGSEMTEMFSAVRGVIFICLILATEFREIYVLEPWCH